MIDELIGILERENVEWELYWEKGRGSSFKIERGELERAQRKFHSGVGLRIGVDGKQGFSYITGLTHDRGTLEKFVKHTIKLAKVGGVPFLGFPDRKPVPRVKDLYDPKIENMGFEEALNDALELLGSERAEMERLGSEYLFSASLAFGVAHDGVANSNGIFMESEATAMTVSTYVVRRGDKTGTGSHYLTFRTLPKLEDAFEEGISKALEEAELSYMARPLESYGGELLLEPHALSAVIGILVENLNAENVHHGRSRFREPGEEVGGGLTLVDDATLPGGMGSYPFDGEGNPGRRTPLVEDGQLKSFLFDEYYARLFGVESTGNAVRDFRTKPHIGTSNIIVEPGKESLEDFEGVIIKRVFGEHTANPVSGDFSLTVGLGYVVRNGEVVPFKDNMFTGNVFELLKKVRAVGDKTERIGTFIAPRVLTEGRVV
ncbi:TldD/PmbA family protein [Palaeococcus ferrophilus]|uniref:TldD/PmbA family protein n=1 Tax=Palaeococcus ferrophilus TaxID=83868 RepID=UPI00064ED07A|nr:TldD/PmbA family protein [Palaeococcus ferrophilus]